MTTIAAPDTTDLVERLAAHKTIGGAPRAELEWLAKHGTFVQFKKGELAAAKGDPVTFMFIQLSGRTSAFIERGTGRRYTLETHGGEVTALLPFSRLTSSIGDVVVVEPVDGVIVDRDQFPAMIRDCPHVIETLVHTMVDRARALQSNVLQDDKMASLGRLAAGLAHELNNPASAAARSAKLLKEALNEAHEASHALGAARLTAAQRMLVADLSTRSMMPATTGVFSAIERSDHEDEITKWLEAHHADVASATAIADSGVAIDTLDELADAFTGDAFAAALRWIAAEYTAQALASDVERATTRIYELVSAVKRFTYMDRTTTTEPTNVAQGVIDTVTMLAAKARAKSVSVKVELAAELPLVAGSPGELNQVWSNLLENAIDAVAESGHVVVSAERDGTSVVVRVIDDGPGIPPDVEARIFDPFFTTKPIGQGTGLGLDISRRVVLGHAGQIAVETRPGRTEFRVILPTERAQHA